MFLYPTPFQVQGCYFLKSLNGLFHTITWKETSDCLSVCSVGGSSSTKMQMHGLGQALYSSSTESKCLCSQKLLHWESVQEVGNGHTELLRVKPCIRYNKWAHQDGHEEVGCEQARRDARPLPLDNSLIFHSTVSTKLTRNRIPHYHRGRFKKKKNKRHKTFF